MAAEPPVMIYALVDDEGSVHYVGQTRRPEQRSKAHGRVWPTLTMIVLTYTDDVHADAVERSWIEHYRGEGCRLLNAKSYRPGGRRVTARSDAGTWATVSVWLTRDERERICCLARRENRSMKGQIKQFIDEGLAARAAAQEHAS